MLERIARTSYRHRWVVLIAWIVTLVAAVSVGRAFAGDFATGGKLPNTESRRAFDLLESRFPAHAGDGGTIVFKAEQGVTDPQVQAAMEAMFAKVAQVPGVTGVVSPYSNEGQNQISKDGTIAYAQVNTVDLNFNEWGPVSDGVRAVRAEVNVPGLTVELGGDIFSDGVKPPATEAFGLLAAVFILLVAFGSVLAMGLPIVTALFGIAIGIAVVELLANVMPVPDFTTQVAAMIAIGVGIDYALFIVTRYREFLKDGARPDVAVLRSINTAGRAVVFAGLTVVISLLGMFLMGVPFVRGLAVGCSAAVLLVMLGSITLLPALLGFVGLNIDRFGLPHRKKREAAAAQKESLWHRWARTVQRRPWPPFAGGLLILVLLAAPFFSLRLGMADAGNQPTTDTTRRAYDLLAEGFGPGFNGPLLVVADQQGGTSTRADVARLHDALTQVPGVAFVSPAIPNPAGDTAVIQVFPTSAPQDEATTKLIHHLRSDVVPAATKGTDMTVYVGGFTAASQDFADVLSSRLPLFIGAVLGLSFLLLLVVFRSIVVPLKAVIMNLLSIAAAYGVIVAVFQWGWLSDVFGVGKPGPIEAWAPMMLFAIVFGLSMDYEVFLLSRIKEEYDRTGDNGQAVADGLASTARVITAAAAIMICVFGSFVLGDQRQIKLIGLGLAAAVFIDATLVRMVLVPATMELLGDRNWWFPKWLDRIVPRVSIEAHDLDRELADLTQREDTNV